MAPILLHNEELRYSPGLVHASPGAGVADDGEVQQAQPGSPRMRPGYDDEALVEAGDRVEAGSGPMMRYPRFQKPDSHPAACAMKKAMEKVERAAQL